MKKATFVIAVYDDDITLKETVDNLMTTVSPNDVDIIVVDDANTLDPAVLFGHDNIILYCNEQRRGVGYSLDYGIQKANTEIVFPMGCDIRFDGNWFDRFYSVVRDNPKSIVSTITAGLNEKRRYIQGNENHYHAAHTLFHVTTKNNNRVLPFREYLEAKWNEKKNLPESDLIQIGCVLGAFYGVNKTWWNHIGGFKGHRTWGTLEPLISLRSYINGGNCLLDRKTITGHIFKGASSHKPIKDLIYNKLLVAYTLLPVDMEKIAYTWADGLKGGKEAIALTQKNKTLFDEFRKVKNSLDDSELRRRIEPTGILNE